MSSRKFGFLSPATISFLRMFLLVLMIGVLSLIQTQAADCWISGRITDAQDGGPTPCTVTITDANGNIVTETASFKGGFRCDGQFRKQIPAGVAKIRIARGFETRVIEQIVNLAPGETTNLNFVLERKVDLRRRGWYGGDNHVHMLHGEKTVPVEFDFVALTAQAEDLQFLSLAQAWNIDKPTPERLETELKARSKPNCQLFWNLEAPKNYYLGDAGRCLGHCWNIGMRGRAKNDRDVIALLLDASAWDYESQKPTFANFESHQLIHEQGGAVFYSHPARWWQGPWGGQGGYPRRESMRVSNMAVELPLDTVIGPTYDGLDVITGPGEFAANAKAFEIWKLLLNHGYRLAATGSSDACFDRPGGAVPGVPRTYVYVPGNFSIAKATRAIATGRTFVTTGPLLLASLDGSPPGTGFAASDRKRQLQLETWSSGTDSKGLSFLQIFRDGELWQQFRLAGVDYFKTNISLAEPHTAWYCAKAIGSDPQRQVAVSGAFYFADTHFHRPQPVPARVHAQVLDAASGKPVSATLTEVTFAAKIQRNGKRHHLTSGQGVLEVPATARLRAQAKGFRPLTLSPFLDNAPLVKMITELSDTNLVEWQTFEQVKNQLANVELVFRLQQE
jgi:hypothetical protein